MFLPVGSPLSLSSSVPSSLAATPPSPAPSSSMNANALPFYPTSDTVESVVGKCTSELLIDKGCGLNIFIIKRAIFAPSPTN